MVAWSIQIISKPLNFNREDFHAAATLSNCRKISQAMVHTTLNSIVIKKLP